MSESQEPQSAAPAEPPSAETVPVVVQGETRRYQRYLNDQVGLLYAGPTRGWVGTTSQGRVWFMTEKLGLTVRVVPYEELTKFRPSDFPPRRAAPAPLPPSGAGAPPGAADGAPPTPGASRNHVRGLEESRRARRDGSRSCFEDYLAYREGGRESPRLNANHWQPDPQDTVSGVGEAVESSQVPEAWSSELFEREQATLPGSEEAWR